VGTHGRSLCRVHVGWALGKGSITVIWHCHDDFSSLSASWHSAKTLLSAQHKELGKYVVVDKQFTKSSLLSATLGIAFVECY
jgi:hypothetical protein